MKLEKDLESLINKSSKIFIVWAAGSGKSTLARKIAKEKWAKHLELDDFFREIKYTKKADLDTKTKKLNKFLENNTDRIIEWIFIDWIDEIYKKADLVIILDMPNHKIIRRHAKRFLTRKVIQRRKEETIKSCIGLIKFAISYQNKDSEYSKYRHIQDCKKYWCNYAIIDN